MYSQTSYNETLTGCRLSCGCTRATEYFQNGLQIHPKSSILPVNQPYLIIMNRKHSIKNKKQSGCNIALLLNVLGQYYLIWSYRVFSKLPPNSPLYCQFYQSINIIIHRKKPN